MPHPVLTNGGTSKEWELENPILPSGKAGTETDTGKYKVGNGSSFWNALKYFNDFENHYWKNSVDGNHKSTELTPEQAGIGLFYWKDTEDIVYSTGNIFIPLCDFNPDFFAPLKSNLLLINGKGSATFTRATTATVMGYASGAVSGDSQVLLTVAANEARFEGSRRISEGVWSTYFNDGVPIPDATIHGYLSEGSRTNLALQSEDFSTTWTLPSSGILAFGSGSTLNAIASPSGTLTAEKIVESNITAIHVVRQSISTANATFSVYVKAAERSRIGIGLQGATVKGQIFDLSTQVVSNFSSSYLAADSYSMVSVGNGWYRCSITNLSVGITTVDIYIINDGIDRSYQGDGTSGIYIWGAQIEAASFASSYIPTTTASVTRNEDSLTYPLLDNLGTYRTMYLESYLNNKKTANNEGFLSWSNDTTNNQNVVNILHKNNTKPYLSIYNVATEQTISGSSTSANYTNGIRKIAVSFGANSFKYYENGALIEEDKSGTVPDNLSLLSVGKRNDGSALYGAIRNVKFWHDVLPNGKIINL